MSGSIDSLHPDARRIFSGQGTRVSSFRLLVALAILVALVASSFLVQQTASSLAVSNEGVRPATLPAGGTPDSSGAPASLGSDVLAQASQSLEAGAGPALGSHLSCGESTGLSSVRCTESAASTLPSLAWSPVGAPIGRDAVSMVYDVADGYVVLFGNGASSSVQGDTWIFEKGTWTELSTPNAPSARLGAFMSYDTHDGYVLLFGGWGGSNGGPSEYGDTWSFTGGQWHLLIPESACTGNTGATPCPSPRDSGGLADDPADGYVILFGDYNGDEDTWGFSGGHWVLLISPSSCTENGGTTTCPPGLGDEAFAWDPALQEDILFGGYPVTNETWAFHGGSWTALIAPSQCTGPGGPDPCPAAREESSLSYDSSDGYLVLFGGYTGSADLGDVWDFDAGVWHEATGASGCTTCPEGRSDSGLVDDPSMGGLLMFGGYGYPVPYGDTWVLSAGTWSPVAMSQTPGPRWDASLAWDPAMQAVLLFGGFEGQALGDTWTFSSGVWTEIDAAGACTSSTCPTPRLGAALAWDGKDAEMVLFGGMSPTGGYMRDTWTFSDGIWDNILASGSCTATTCPTARANASAIWDAADGELVLFGGYGGAYENDTWSFSGTAWTEVIASSACTNLAPCPSPRELAGVAQAPLPTGGVLVFGGTTASGNTNDTWWFKGGSWTEILSNTQCKASYEICPGTNAGFGLAYLPSDNLDILSGGGTHSGLEETWVFSADTWTQVLSSTQCRSLYDVCPSERSYASLVYDGSGGNLLLVGGYSAYGLLPDVWAIGSPMTVATPTVTPSSPDVGQSVVFDDAISGGGTATYTISWEGLPAGCATVAGSAASFTCTPTAAGSYYVTTVATPSNGLAGVTSPHFLSFDVNPDPVVTISSNSSAETLGQAFNLTAVASGGTGTFTQYEWWGLPAGCGTPLGPNATISCNPDNRSDLGTWQVRVSATDSSGFNVTSAPLALVVAIAPWSVAVVLNPTTIDLSQYVSFGSYIQGISGSFTYTWNGLPPGCSGSSGTLLCDPTAAGQYAISLTATSPLNGSETSPTVLLTVLNAMGPTTLTVSSSSITVGESLTLQASLSGGESPYQYAWTGLPAGCLAQDTATITCSPTAPGSYSVNVSISDATRAKSLSASVSVTVNPLAVGSLVLAASPSVLDLGQSTTVGAVILGGSGGTPTLTWTGLPTGCSASGTTFSCTPTATGTFYMAAQATLTGGSTLSSNVVTVQVDPKLSAILLQANPTSPTVGEILTFSASAGGGDGSYAYTWTGLPSGCATVDSAQVSCVPTSAGPVTVTVTIVDMNGAVETSSALSLTVQAAPSPAPAGFAAGDSGLDWTVFVLVVLAVVLVVVSLLLSMRRPPKALGPSVARPGPEAWRPQATANPSIPEGPSSTSAPAASAPKATTTPGSVRGGYVARPMPPPGANGTNGTPRPWSPPGTSP